MIDDINLLFNPKTKEYVIVSGKNSLILSEKDFKAVKESMNGISYALQVKSRKLREAAVATKMKLTGTAATA